MGTDIEKWLEGDGEVFLVAGKEGKVYAVDKDREALDKLTQIAESKGLRNILIIRTSGDLKIDLKEGNCFHDSEAERCIS